MDSVNSGENRLGSIVDYACGDNVVRVPADPNEETKFGIESDTMMNLNDFSDEIEDDVEILRVDQMGEESQWEDSSSDDSDVFWQSIK